MCVSLILGNFKLSLETTKIGNYPSKCACTIIWPLCWNNTNASVNGHESGGLGLERRKRSLLESLWRGVIWNDGLVLFFSSSCAKPRRTTAKAFWESSKERVRLLLILLTLRARFSVKAPFHLLDPVLLSGKRPDLSHVGSQQNVSLLNVKWASSSLFFYYGYCRDLVLKLFDLFMQGYTYGTT